MIAAIETFWIFLLIAAGSAFFNWLKKNSEPSGESRLPDSEPRRNTPSPESQASPRKTVNWEEELRKMLDIPAASPPPAPPRVIQKSPPPPPPAPASYRLPTPPVVTRRAPLPKEIAEEDTALRVPSWGSSNRRYDEASRLGEKTMAHLRDVTRQPVGSTHIDSFTQRAPEVAQMLALLSTSRGARQAVIALSILGPPKSLDT